MKLFKMSFLKVVLTLFIVLFSSCMFVYYYFFITQNHYEVNFGDGLIYGKSVLNYNQNDLNKLRKTILSPEKFCLNDRCEINKISANKYDFKIQQSILSDDKIISLNGMLTHIIHDNNKNIELVLNGNIAKLNSLMFGQIPIKIDANIDFINNNKTIEVNWNCKISNFLIERFDERFIEFVIKDIQTIMLRKTISS